MSSKETTQSPLHTNKSRHVFTPMPLIMYLTCAWERIMGVCVFGKTNKKKLDDIYNIISPIILHYNTSKVCYGGICSVL